MTQTQPIKCNTQRKCSHVHCYLLHARLRVQGLIGSGFWMFIHFRSSDNNKNDRESAEARAQKDRSITNMRNKDRPSLQIYQPGAKRRTSNSSGGDSHSCENKNRVEYEADAKVDNNVPSTSTSSSKGHDNRKRNDKKDCSAAATTTAATTKGHSEDNSKKSTSTATEKRISRYSEKRNKVKEKRDLSDNPATANDCASSSNNKGPTDEMFSSSSFFS